MSAQEVAKELRGRKEPDEWLAYAQSHKRAAEILFGHIEASYPDGEPVNLEDTYLGIANSAMLLLGLAIELAIKAFLLKQQIKTWEEISMPGPLSKHDLLEQYKLTNLSLTNERQWILQYLTRFTVWAGKYPTPKKDNQFSFVSAEFSLYGCAASLPPIAFSRLERNKVVALIDELAMEFDK